VSTAQSQVPDRAAQCGGILWGAAKVASPSGSSGRMVVVEAMLAIAFSEQTANFPERPAGFMTGIMQNRGRGHGVAAVPACVHSLLPTDLILTLTACGNDQRPPERPRRCM